MITDNTYKKPQTFCRFPSPKNEQVAYSVTMSVTSQEKIIPIVDLKVKLSF